MPLIGVAKYFDLNLRTGVCEFNQPVAKVNFPCFYPYFSILFPVNQKTGDAVKKFLKFNRNEVVD
jgi:hypothetical protein